MKFATTSGTQRNLCHERWIERGRRIRNWDRNYRRRRITVLPIIAVPIVGLLHQRSGGL
jgi:hypothetical protein